MGFLADEPIVDKWTEQLAETERLATDLNIENVVEAIALHGRLTAEESDGSPCLVGVFIVSVSAGPVRELSWHQKMVDIGALGGPKDPGLFSVLSELCWFAAGTGDWAGSAFLVRSDLMDRLNDEAKEIHMRGGLNIPKPSKVEAFRGIPILEHGNGVSAMMAIRYWASTLSDVGPTDHPASVQTTFVMSELENKPASIIPGSKTYMSRETADGGRRGVHR